MPKTCLPKTGVILLKLFLVLASIAILALFIYDWLACEINAITEDLTSDYDADIPDTECVKNSSIPKVISILCIVVSCVNIQLTLISVYAFSRRKWNFEQILMIIAFALCMSLLPLMHIELEEMRDEWDDGDAITFNVLTAITAVNWAAMFGFFTNAMLRLYPCVKL